MSTIKFDIRGPSRAINDEDQGLIVERGVQVLDFPVANLTGTNSDPMVLLRCLFMLGTGPGDYVNRFPQVNDFYPPPSYTGSGGGSGDDDPDLSNILHVCHQEITGLDRTQRIVAATIRYRSPAGPGGSPTPTYAVNDSFQISQIPTMVTAGGSEVLSTWFQPGYDNNEHWIAPTSPNDTLAFGEVGAASVLVARAQRVISSRVITAVSSMGLSVWDAAKSGFRTAAGKINSDTSGNFAPRGKWLYPGPIVTFNNASTVAQVTHTLIEGVGSGRWFALLPFYNQHNEYPAEAAPEANLATATFSPGFPPPVGGQIRINGLTMASIQPEANFAALFGSFINPS